MSLLSRQKLKRFFFLPNSFHFSFVTANMRDDVEYHQSRALVESYNVVLSLLLFLKWIISALYTAWSSWNFYQRISRLPFDLKLNSTSVAAAGRLKVNSDKLSRPTDRDIFFYPFLSSACARSLSHEIFTMRWPSSEKFQRDYLALQLYKQFSCC